MRNGTHRKRRARPRLLRSAVLLAATALFVPLNPAGGATAPAAVQAAPAADRAALEAPPLTTTTTGREDDGLLLTTPSPDHTQLGGAAIYDNSGELVWWREGPYMNLEQVSYRGQPALSLFDNTDLGGRYLLLDSFYQEIGSYRMDGYFTDSHEFDVSPDGKRVLILGYGFYTRDLSEYGGRPDAQVIDAVIQEQDIDTGEVLFEWRALDHIPLEETEEPLTGELVDYVHTNSVTYDTDGDLLMSARHTSTVYKIDRSTGDILWRLGGESSDFAFADAADRPSYQHDAERLPDGRLLLFDNGNKHDPQRSRGAVYTLDESARTATLDADLQPQDPLFAVFAGSARGTGNGNILLGFGSAGPMVEFADGEPVFTATFPEGTWWSYRAVRADWQATPAGRPDVSVGGPSAGGKREFAMSWNGATEVDGWRVEAGPSRRDLAEADTVDRTGFETRAKVAVPDDTRTVRVSALDAGGRVLGSRILTADDLG